MKRSGFVATGVAVMLAMVGALSAVGADGNRKLRTELSGFQEPPAILTVATGEFEATISRDESGFEYQLSYENLEGDVRQAHIHIAQLSINGGIAVWLCQTATNPAPAAVAAATPDCGGPNSGTVNGMVTAAQVVGPGGQGVSPGELEEVFRAMRNGAAYVNVHSSKWPGGEIRGQLRLEGGQGRGANAQ